MGNGGGKGKGGKGKAKGREGKGNGGEWEGKVLGPSPNSETTRRLSKAPKSTSAGASPRTPLGELTALLQTS